VSLEIRPVTTKSERKAFIDFPYRLYAQEPTWVPPLRFERKKHLDPNKSPFFEHAEVQLFLAERDNEVVGRISAHIDHALDRHKGTEWGLWGFFESVDDQAVADALLEAVEAWHRGRGRDRMIGPFDFSTNHECGLLVEGHDRDPIILTNWHFPYYQRLLESYGMSKAMDTLMWELWVQDRERVHPAIWAMADKVESEHGIVCRGFRKKDLDSEVGKFLEVYNEAWEDNWGSVPLTEGEIRAYAKDLKPVLDENWAMMAERKDTGEVVGAALTLPDFNQALKATKDGRLFPFGWLKVLRAQKKINAVRVFALGVKRDYQHTGVAAKLYEMHFDAAARTPQKGGEMGWILETNTAMNRGMEGMGGRVVRRYRFYEKLLRPDAEPSHPGGEYIPAQDR
jgi:GNAT superfamily N-acetyltransferase